MEAAQRGRGRLPGEMKGKKYNVPKRVQVTVNLLEKDLVKLDAIAEQNNVSRSSLVSTLLSQYMEDKW